MRNYQKKVESKAVKEVRFGFSQNLTITSESEVEKKSRICTNPFLDSSFEEGELLDDTVEGATGYTPPEEEKQADDAAKTVKMMDLTLCSTSEDDEDAKTHEIPKLTLEDPLLLVGLPLNIFLLAKQYPDFETSADVLAGQADFYIYVSEVYSPHRFWFNMDDGHGSFFELERTQHDLKFFYNDQLAAETYRMHPADIMVGRACAALFDNVWHRAEIVGPLDAKQNKAKIFFVDYGTVSNVRVDNLRHLTLQFSVMPRQAQRGRVGALPWSGQTQVAAFGTWTVAAIRLNCFCTAYPRRCCTPRFTLTKRMKRPFT